jgi:hypothetical protein
MSAKKLTGRAGKASGKKGSGSRRSASRPRAERAEVKKNLGAVQSLPALLATAGELSPEDRLRLIDQALVMIEQVYVHLPLKRAMHAVDPVQRLRLLRLRLASLSDRVFHDELISIYTHLRDLHTNYILPDPYRSRVAFLPFRIEEYFDAGERKYLVTEVSPLVTDPNFKPGAVPTHWNGVPIDRAVEVNAEREAGSNLAARHAQGLASLTNRWLGMSLPPDEDWVVLRYKDGSTVRESRFDWQALQPGTPASGIDPLGARGGAAAGLGLDAKTEMQRRVRKQLFSAAAMRAERQMAAAAVAAGVSGGLGLAPGLGIASAAAFARAAEHAGADLSAESLLPDVFPRFLAVTGPAGKQYGYIRLATFMVNDVGQFVQEFIRIASLLPPGGLILDVRGNGGGVIAAGEMLLQLLTP